MTSLCVLSVLLSLSQTLFIKRVEVSGNSLLQTPSILEEFGIKRGESLGEEEIEERVERVLQLYRDIGYWRASIEVESSQLEDGVLLKLLVDEGEPTLVEGVVVEGNRLLTDEGILSQFGSKVGEPFRESSFREDADNLLRRYENRGHPFARLSPTEFSVDSSGVHFTLRIEEGPLVIVDRVEVEGNNMTKDWVITREMGVAEGEVYSQDRIDKGRRRVGRLPFLTGEVGVEIRPAYGLERVALVLGVVEGMPNRASGAVGYMPRRGSGGEVTGAFDLVLGNLFGTGRRIEAGWRRLSPLSSSVRFRYLEPWVLGRGLNLLAGLNHVIQDTSYADTEFGLTLDTPVAEYVSFTASAGWERVVPSALAIPRSSKYKASIGGVLDVRDNPKNPERGVLYRVSTEYGYKRNYPTELSPNPEPRARVMKGDFSLANFFSVFSRQVLYLCLNGGEVRSTEREVPIWEYFKLGGAKTMRGYYEEEFSGERVGWVNSEYRFLIGRSSRVGPFLDLGYFQYQEEDGTAVKETKIGYGLGMRVGTSWGVFFLDYGLGEGDGPLEGKVHFGFEKDF